MQTWCDVAQCSAHTPEHSPTQNAIPKWQRANRKKWPVLRCHSDISYGGVWVSIWASRNRPLSSIPIYQKCNNEPDDNTAGTPNLRTLGNKPNNAHLSLRTRRNDGATTNTQGHLTSITATNNSRQGRQFGTGHPLAQGHKVEVHVQQGLLFPRLDNAQLPSSIFFKSHWVLLEDWHARQQRPLYSRKQCTTHQRLEHNKTSIDE